MTEKLKLLAVFPHPDDETLGLGGTFAKYAAEGVETYLICATRGERGWPFEDRPHPGLKELGRIREAELHCAASSLGIHELVLLDYIDGDVDQANPHEIIPCLAAHIRRIRPQVVITFPPDGNYGHPDHIALAQFTAGALVTAADASFHDEDNLSPFKVSKFYHMVDTRSLVDEFNKHLGPITMDVDGLVRSHPGWEEWAVTTRITIAPYFDTIWQAVLCHQTQLTGYGPLTELPREILMRFWAEGNFVRVYSLVNGGRSVESDLFEGLRST